MLLQDRPETYYLYVARAPRPATSRPRQAEISDGSRVSARSCNDGRAVPVPVRCSSSAFSKTPSSRAYVVAGVQQRGRAGELGVAAR